MDNADIARQQMDKRQEQEVSNYINQKTSQAESEHVAYQDEKKQRVTNSDLVKEDVKIEGKKILDANAEVRRVNNTFGKMKLAGVIGLTAFGVASVLDVQKELREARQVERMKNIQEENAYEKQKEERKTMSQFGYGNVDFGQMAIDMFDQRIGHYKMGNSKFQ